MEPARRIVSLSPAVTESLLALGVGDRLVGVSSLCVLPEGRALPRVGTMVSTSFEAIAALRPDALVAVEGPLRDEVIARLHASGVRAYAPRFESVADVRRCLPTLASLAGRPEAATELMRSIDAGLANVRTALERRPRRRVLAVCSTSPLVVAGTSSWVGELLALAGGDNPVRSSSPYPLWSMEQVMSTVPEVVIDLTGASPPLADAWASNAAIPAVATRSVRRVGDGLVRRQGPRIVDAVRALARAIHPEVTL